MHFTLDDIQQMAGQAAFNRGEAYFRKHKVMFAKLDEVHQQIIADVQGSEPDPYEVVLYQEGKLLSSACSCPVGFNCKHGVAAALQWLSDWQPGNPPPATPAKTPLAQWLAELPTDEVESHTGESPLQTGRHYLLYRLEHHQGRHRLLLYKAYLKHDGGWSQHKRHLPNPYLLGRLSPDFFLPEDQTLLHRLPLQQSTGTFLLQGGEGRHALMQLLHSRRLMLAETDLFIQAAQPRELHWQWQESDGEHRLLARLEGVENWEPIAVTPPCYLDRDKATIGDILTPLSGPRLVHLCAMPPVPRQDMALTAAHLRRVFTPEQLPLTEEPSLLRVDTPVPHLTLTVARLQNGMVLPGTRLHFDYGALPLPPCYRPPFPDQPQLQEHDGRQYLVERDWPEEVRYCDRLYDLGLRLFVELGDKEELWALEAGDGGKLLQQWRQWLEQGLPGLEAQGWQVSRAEDYQLQVQDARVAIRLQDRQNGWFDFSLGLQLGEARLDTMAVIGAWLRADMPAELVLPMAGGWLRLDARPLWTIRDLLLELFDQDRLGQPVPLPAFQAAQLRELDLDDRQAPLTRAMLEQLRDFEGLQSVPVPAGLVAELRPYQQQGLNWLAFLHHYSFGGILADDMGLGKTLQTLALLQHLKETQQLRQPAMIVAPTSLVGNWQHEAARFTPGLKVLLVHGPRRDAAFERIAEQDLVITTYPLLLRDNERYQEHSFGVLVLDEAQAIKNPVTKIAQRVRELRATLRLCLSGTPLENHLGELWALMDFALPGLLGGRSRFNRSYRQPIENAGDRQRQQELGRRLAPFMLRRTKAEVVRELPEKTEITQYVELQGKQRALYESIRVSMEKRLRTLVAEKGMARSHIEFLDALLKLRQACIDPRLVKLEKAGDIREHAKLDWLKDAIPRLLEEGRHILVFSQFTEVLGLIETDLKRQNITYSKLTGQTRKRQQAIDRFQQGVARVFLVSLKAGGSGLNLTAADVVIHVDPWWNPAVENQATDRAHRIGQDKPVFVYKLVAADTVEERIQQLQQHKQALADALFSDAGSAGLPTDADSLLALLG